jgi:hypothetical protein
MVERRTSDRRRTDEPTEPAGRERDGDDREQRTRGAGDRLIDLVRRSEDDAELIDRVQARHERPIPRGRIERLVEIERARLDSRSTPTVDPHAPRYVQLADLEYLTDGEFARVVARLLSAIDGHATIPGARDAESRRSANESKREPTDEPSPGVAIRWERTNRTVEIYALGAEPGRVIDGTVVGRIGRKRESAHRKRGVDSPDSADMDREHDAGNEGTSWDTIDRDELEPRIVTVAPVAPSGVRMAVRSGVGLDDRTVLDEWLDRVALSIGAFGSVIESARPDS